jgi:hypothetical protein
MGKVIARARKASACERFDRWIKPLDAAFDAVRSTDVQRA